MFFYLVRDDGPPFDLVPEGSEGELWIGGIGVAKGYHNAPDLTEQVRIMLVYWKAMLPAYVH